MIAHPEDHGGPALPRPPHRAWLPDLGLLVLSAIVGVLLGLVAVTLR